MMIEATEQIVAQALSLPPSVRAFLAERLIESLDVVEGGELSAAWKAEIQRRCRDMDAGQVELRDSEEVFAQAFASLT